MRIRVEQIHLFPNPVISKACHFSNNLYNEGNYLVRQEFINNGNWLRYNQLYHQVNDSQDYRALPAQSSQQILRLLDNNWKSFFNAINDRKKHPEKYQGRPKLPKYRKKNGEYLLLFTNQQVTIKNSFLHLPKKLGQVKTRISQKLRGARILPQGIGYLLEILYEIPDVSIRPQQNRIASID